VACCLLIAALVSRIVAGLKYLRLLGGEPRRTEALFPLVVAPPNSSRGEVHDSTGA